MDDEEEPKVPENPMEKMISAAQFDKNSLSNARYFSGVLLMIEAQKILRQDCYIWKPSIQAKKLSSISIARVVWSPAVW